MPSKTYNLRAVQLIVGGIPITGFGADDAISFEFDADLSEMAMGLDGEHVNRKINNDLVRCTISLLPTSAANAQLLALHRTVEQALDAGVEASAIGFLMKDPLNGDVVADDVAYFQSMPTPNKGSDVSTSEWVMALPNARGTMILAGAR